MRLMPGAGEDGGGGDAGAEEVRLDVVAHVCGSVDLRKRTREKKKKSRKGWRGECGRVKVGWRVRGGE